nr:immunoglobulin heavy chain junction region [Mus musculus]
CARWDITTVVAPFDYW